MVTAKKIRVISVYLHRETTAESRRFAGNRPYFSTLTGCNILKNYHSSLMNRLAVSAKVFALTLSLGVMASCGTPNNQGAPSKDTKDKTEKTADKGTPTSLNIRYIDGDSVTANYQLAKDFQQLTLSSLSKIDNARQARGNELQKMGANIEAKTKRNGYLSQESYEADVNAFNKKQQEAAAMLDNMQARAQQEIAQRQIELNDSIEAFIRDYNKEKGYDAILFKAAGVYFNPALDITKEVIDGLNARYEKGRKAK